MYRDEANCILAILEIATEGNWHSVIQTLEDRGYTPSQVITAWKSLEKIAGVNGTAPCLEDF